MERSEVTTVVKDGRKITTTKKYRGNVLVDLVSTSESCDTKTRQTPSYQTPTYQTQTYQTPTYQTPTYQTPTYQTPTYQTPSYQTPTSYYQTPTYQNCQTYQPSTQYTGDNNIVYELPNGKKVTQKQVEQIDKLYDSNKFGHISAEDMTKKIERILNPIEHPPGAPEYAIQCGVPYAKYSVQKACEKRNELLSAIYHPCKLGLYHQVVLHPF